MDLIERMASTGLVLTFWSSQCRLIVGQIGAKVHRGGLIKGRLETGERMEFA